MYFFPSFQFIHLITCIKQVFLNPIMWYQNFRVFKFMSKATPMDAGKVKGGSMGPSYPMLTKTNYTTRVLKLKVFMQTHGDWKAVEPIDPKNIVEERIDRLPWP